MTTTWNNRTGWFDLSGGNDEASFLKHVERMKMFRKSHADVVMANGSRCYEPALLKSTRPLQFLLITRGTGGSRLDSGTMAWSTLVPALNVAQYKLSPN